MKPKPPLYKALYQLISLSLFKDKRHKVTLLWMVYGLISIKDINLPEWIPFVQSRAQQAQSTERRFSRWFHNSRIDIAMIYDPLIKNALKLWEESTLYIALDTSMLWNRFCQIRLCVIYRGRAIPLVWQTIEHGSISVKLSRYKDLLSRAKTLLPEGTKVVFLADRGFIDIKLMQFASEKLHWNWRIRYKVKINTYRLSKNKKKYCKLKMTAH